MIGAVRSRVPPDEVLEMFDDAVGAFVTEAGRVDDWDRPACGTWTGTELARHVLSVIGWYHDWLDRAEAGDSSPAFAIDDLAARNARDLADLARAWGSERAGGDRAVPLRAERYAERLEDTWDLPFGYPRGTVTAGSTPAWPASSGRRTRGTSPTRPDGTTGPTARPGCTSRPPTAWLRPPGPRAARSPRSTRGASCSCGRVGDDDPRSWCSTSTASCATGTPS